MTRVTILGVILYMVFAVMAVLLVGMGMPAHGSVRVRTVDYVVDGDTVRLVNGTYVRFIGINTPEVGECGAARATRVLDRLVNGRVRLVNPRSVDNRDQYGRLLRYVEDQGRDTGLALLRRGLAEARYDSRDGYDPHPREGLYHRADRRNPDVC